MASSAVIDGLHQAVANATVFYQKLRAFHWMVKGHEFFKLHEKFEELYTGWAEVIDELAERAVQLGGAPPLTLADVLKTTKLAEESSSPDACKMVELILADLHSQEEQFRKLIASAEDASDRTTANVLDDVIDEIEKNRWMLRAFLAK
ncbi:MAG: DNA starvation/stationary phase protection protein [Phycisphaerales bacterium]|nr:DNA starvation/stationary phase protection protein [Phycisphaerales bacterium]